MEYQSEEEADYSEVIDNLMHMFGNVLDKDAIATVVESCAGDLNISIDTIMNITNEGNVIQENISKVEDNTEHIIVSTEIPENAPSKPMPMSYASISQPSNNQTGAVRKIQKPTQQVHSFWTDQIREIITNHNQGNRTMVIMRGLPGSGKSYLAKQLVDMMIGPDFNSHKTHIFSTDDYFIIRGKFEFNQSRLHEAHFWNQNRVKVGAFGGVSPIIVDNTNIELWEMEPYTKFAVENGYILEVVEPNTHWARKATQLFRRNTHNVPLHTIQRKLEMFQNGITGESLKRAFRVSYPAHMVPPVKRIIPKLNIPEGNTARSCEVTSNKKTSDSGTTSCPTNPFLNALHNHEIRDNDLSPVASNSNYKNEKTQPEEAYDLTNDEKEFEINNEQNLLQAEKVLEEMQKVEQEWENGDPWDKPVTNASSSVPSASTTLHSKLTALPSLENLKLESKPPRSNSPKSNQQSPDTVKQTVNDCQDWTNISMFLPPWVSPSELTSTVQNEKISVETKSSGTCMEIGDTDLNGSKKVMTTTPKNINEDYMPINKEKIPDKRMLDKGVMTNEDLLTNQYRCSNEEKHFIAFCKLFKTIDRSDLRDIFDKCCGDVNWAVEIVLDGVVNKQFKTVEAEDISDEDDECVDSCQCLATYNVIPDVGTSNVAPPLANQPPQSVSNEDEERTDMSQQPQKKKRDIISDENMQIKRQIEKNVVISDNHYSEHCLKLRKWRRGENTTQDPSEQPSTSTDIYDPSPILSANQTVDDYLSDDDSDVSDDTENIVSVNLGWEYIKEIDRMFGRQDMEYPENIVPKISIPLCVLNQINALWMESLMYQMDMMAKQSAEMIKRDEQFAREIAMKEAELSLAGIEPQIPDFKEIMDMDLALSLYQKDVAEWRNNMPTDLAAKMTRDKLYNVFPDVNKDTLSELLMAHDNNFKLTVETLLTSTGRKDVLETENGVNKFVMEKELMRQEKILEERRKELEKSEADWPLLSKGEKIEMSTITDFRHRADQHLERSNINHQKAQEYMGRGMLSVANYYAEMAQFHRREYEHSNSLAVTALMQYHAMNSPDSQTIDLHYLRVMEAMESLDVFLDTHIQKLRESNIDTVTTLFIITGRGKNSVGKARIKPATKKRLEERGLRFAEGNPGLLHARVCSSSKLSFQIQKP